MRLVTKLPMLFPADLVEFTDEEGYGRYLDLHDCYLKYINLKSSEVRGWVAVGAQLCCTSVLKALGFLGWLLVCFKGHLCANGCFTVLVLL